MITFKQQTLRMLKSAKICTVATLTFMPYMVFAAQGRTLGGLIDQVIAILNAVIPLIMALALVYFLWGVAEYVRKSGTEKEEGREIMVWGIVALFVMIAVWGLVGVLTGTFFPGGTAQPPIPQFSY